MAMRVLYPAQAPPAAEVLATLRPRKVPTDRPHVMANLIVTIDGATSVDGASGTINAHAPGDKLIFDALREQADAILAGTGTIAGETYGRLVPEEQARERRVTAGLAADPLAVVLSRSGDVPSDVPMLANADQPRRIFTGEDADPTAALHSLRTKDGIEVLLCEGGPTLLGGLLRAGLLDELFLTISPVLAGGAPERTLLGGPPDRVRPLTLRSLLEL
ncbi:MAG: dihydrofolate reductase family protein, partial [Solirubrobacteraceae bacterium]|nr:dihydrofolate reductase family protein [Solirubrobacteraceae bacterium]